jgi:hypothetical protein
MLVESGSGKVEKIQIPRIISNVYRRLHEGRRTPRQGGFAGAIITGAEDCNKRPAVSSTLPEGPPMRYAICCGVVLNLLVLGCRQASAPSTAAEHPPANGEPRAGTDRAAPPDNSSIGGPAKNDANQAGEVVELGAIQLTAPAAWTRKPPGSSFVAAEFSLPRADGDDADGRLTVSTAGGSLEANIDRWKGQFQPQPKSISQEDIDVAGLKATIVDLSGDFNDQRGPFAPGELRPGYRMIAAVIPAGGQLQFIKATGPQKTMASHADAIHQFIRSARPTK